MSLREIVKKLDSKLTDAEERLVKELLSDPESAAFMTAAELAEAVGVHESTAVRMAKTLGFNGYRQLRAELQSELLDTVNSSERIRRRLARTHDLDQLIDDEIDSLSALPETLTQTLLEHAAKTLFSAHRIYLYAWGHATALGELMIRRLRRSGYRVEDLRADGRDLAERLLLLSKQDVLLAFALRNRPPALDALLRQTKKVGAKTIVISDVLGPMIRPKPDVLLWGRRGSRGEFLSHVVPLTICNALVLSLAEHDQGRTLESLDTVQALIQLYGQPGFSD